MREIKFRAWDKHAKIMRDDGTRPDGMPHMKYDVGIMPRHAKNSWATGIDGLEIRVNSNDFELMQFTGLKDKNGKEIYEGDICRVLYTDWGSKDANDPRSIEKYMQDISKVGKVEFEEYEWQFNFGLNRYGETSYGTFHVGAHGRIEVIGNIYENPELLKQ